MPPRRRRQKPAVEQPAEQTPPPQIVEAEIVNSSQLEAPVVTPVRATAASSIELEAALSGQARAVRDVMHRQLQDGAEAATKIYEDGKNDHVLNILDTIVTGIKNGTDISSSQGEISKLILNQESRAELIDNILLTHDYDRLVKYVRARKVLEDFMLLCIQRGDLSATEALAFMKIVMDETKMLQTRVKAGATSIKDVEQLVNKVDFALHAKEAEINKKYDKTSPQGREIIRKLAHALNRVKGGGKPDSQTIHD